MMYVALVVLDKLKGVDGPQHEIAFTEAETERAAINNFAAMDWPRDYWVSGKSICRIKTCMMVDKGDPFFSRRFADAIGTAISDGSKPSKKRKRIRQRSTAAIVPSTSSDTPRRRRRLKK